MLLRRYHKKEVIENSLIEDTNLAYDLAIKENLNYKTVKELKEIAKDKDVEGYSNMKKEELIEVLVGD